MGFLRQMAAISSVLFNGISQWMFMTMPIYVLFTFSKRDDTFKVKPEDAMALFKMNIGANVPGMTVSAVLMKYLGRNVTHRIFILAGVIAWLIIRFAANITALKAAMLFGGLSAGGSIFLGSIIIGEYASPKYRGIFLHLNNAALMIGSLLFAVMVKHLEYETITILGLLPLFTALAIIQVSPESPMWLASKKKYEKSEEVFYKLRGDDEESSRELNELIQTQKERHANKKQKRSLKQKIIDFLLKFISPEFLKPFRIVVIAILLLEMSGKHFLPVYGMQIGRGFTSGDVSAFGGMLFNIIMFVSAIVSVLLLIKARRRTLLFSTGFLACFILILVVFFSALMPVRRPSIIITLISIYSLLTNLSCAPLPLVLMGELFPLEHKGVGSVATGVTSHAVRIGVVYLTNFLLENIKVHWTLFLYSVIMGVCLLILYYILPETKDLTLQDIANYFAKHKATEPVSFQEGFELDEQNEG